MFATERTRYPLSVINSELGTDVVTKTLVTKEQDSKSLTLKNYMAKHGMKSKVMTITKKNADVRVGVPETDWLYFYRFINLNGCWYLREVAG
jgi:hypothetical protein